MKASVHCACTVLPCSRLLLGKSKVIVCDGKAAWFKIYIDIIGLWPLLMLRISFRFCLIYDITGLCSVTKYGFTVMRCKNKLHGGAMRGKFWENPRMQRKLDGRMVLPPS